MAGTMNRRNSAHNIAAFQKGLEDGYPLGWGDGHWMGRCEYVKQLATPVPALRPVHVLYVTSGKGHPYSPLDHAIVESLKLIAERVTLANPTDDVITIAATERPDIMLVLEGMQMPAEKVRAVREQGVRTAVWFTDDPYYTDITAGLAVHYEHVFTLERNCISFYIEKGCSNVHYLPLGAFPVSYHPRNPLYPIRGDICFIGTAYWNRVNLFDKLIPMLAHRRLHISGMWWDRLSEYEQWKGLIELGKWMEPDQTSERYSANKIVINTHRAPNDNTYNQNSAQITAVSPNPRTFEIAASAALQIVDPRDDLAQFYVPGYEIITYDSPEDLASKADYYLEHEEERQAIALRGLYRTLKDHTYVSRLNQLIDSIMKNQSIIP